MGWVEACRQEHTEHVWERLSWGGVHKHLMITNAQASQQPAMATAVPPGWPERATRTLQCTCMWTHIGQPSRTPVLPQTTVNSCWCRLACIGPQLLMW